MKKIFAKFCKSIGIENERTSNIAKHVLYSFGFKGASIIANFLIVPLTIKYLDNENYGIWLTLTSFIAWFSFVDVGLGHGLRNKLAEALAVKDVKAAKGYISTAYFAIGAISLAFFFLAILISFNIKWTVVFNTSSVAERSLQLLMPVVFSCFSLQLVGKLITSIYLADQKHSIQDRINFITAISSLLLIWILTKTSDRSLLVFGMIFSLIPITILLAMNFIGFSSRYSLFRPALANCKRAYLNEIFGLGLRFFVIQLSVIVLFSTDNIIITQLFGPEEVVPYNLSYKYLSISIIVFNILLTPYWSSITDAYVKGEFEWIKKSIKNLVRLSFFTVLFILLLVLLAPVFYQLWVGDMVEIAGILTWSMASYFIIYVLYSPYNFFINGTGKIKLHMIIFIIAAIVNVPLSVFLVNYTTLNVEGVILATVICIAPNLYFFPKQYQKIINKTASGIWAK